MSSASREQRGEEEDLTNNEAHITIRDLTMAYGSFVLMRDLNFTINRGDIFVIMGGSGCGKSTLMKIMVGLKEPARGEVLYDGVSFWETDPVERDRIMRSVGILYQSGALWSSMTLAENVALPLEQYTDLRPSQIREIISLKLSLVGLAGFEEFYPSEISGGMRKRAGLARAMALQSRRHGGGGDPRAGEHLRRRHQLGLSRSGNEDHDRQGGSQGATGRVTGPEGPQLSHPRRSRGGREREVSNPSWGVGFVEHWSDKVYK
jgi:ABC-type ATPase involved in cell division